MPQRYFSICILFIFMFFHSTIAYSVESENKPLTCEEKLNLLEPSEPKTLYDYELMSDRDISTFKKGILPISSVKKNGNNLSFKIIYKDLNWQRPAYDPRWHSSSWRWSYVPFNIAYQQHIIYSYQGGLSWWYDLSNYLALPSDADGPSPLNEYAFTIKYPYVVRLIVFNFNITSIKHYKNQILVSGEPLRKGLIVIDFDVKTFSDSKKLLQLVTPDSYELDYLILNL